MQCAEFEGIYDIALMSYLAPQTWLGGVPSDHPLHLKLSELERFSWAAEHVATNLPGRLQVGVLPRLAVQPAAGLAGGRGGCWAVC